MSDTRQVWKPWRAKTRTAASRMMRRLSIGARAGVATSGPSLDVHLLRPRVCVGAAVGQRGQRAADLGLALEVELGGDVGLRVRRLGEDDAPPVDEDRKSKRLN